MPTFEEGFRAGCAVAAVDVMVGFGVGEEGDGNGVFEVAEVLLA